LILSGRFLRLAFFIAAAAWTGVAIAAADVTAPPPAQVPGGKVDPQRFGKEKQLEPPAEAGATAPPPATEAPPGTVDPQRFGEKQLDPAYGAFQRGLYVTALNLAMPRARNGDPAAQTLVAEILSRGLGVPRNEVEAAKWYALASEQGVPEAQFQYALLLLDGGLVKKDVNGAYALLEAAAEAGNVLAQFNFAQLVVDRQPGEAGMAKAVSYYERAAQAGLADAQYAMSQVCANGVGGKKRDELEARRWLTMAARQGFDTAELDLGTWMVEGRGGPKDRKTGFDWLKRAALGGNVAAQNRVAKLYVQGIGVDPDQVMGAAWYILARRAGLNDPEMDDVMNGLTAEETKQAIEKANRLR
jgi:TPR repeat protein